MAVTRLDSDLSEMSKNETLKVESEGKTKCSVRSHSPSFESGLAPLAHASVDRP